MNKATTSGKTLRPVTPAAVEAAARADRDTQSLTAEDLRRMKRTPRAKITRRTLALTQEEFALHYHIPLGTLRDWEQGRARPDRPTQAYLKIIACEPERVERLLNQRA
jgi:putative transcriptional regulator